MPCLCFLWSDIWTNRPPQFKLAVVTLICLQLILVIRSCQRQFLTLLILTQLALIIVALCCFHGRHWNMPHVTVDPTWLTVSWPPPQYQWHPHRDMSPSMKHYVQDATCSCRRSCYYSTRRMQLLTMLPRSNSLTCALLQGRTEAAINYPSFTSFQRVLFWKEHSVFEWAIDVLSEIIVKKEKKSVTFSRSHKGHTWAADFVPNVP